MRTLLALVVAAASAAGPLAAAVLVVPDEYPTIQSALDAARTDDTVLVQPGTYAEALTISERVTLTTTAGPFATAVDASGTGTRALTVLVAGVLVQDLTLRGGMAGPGSSNGGGVFISADGNVTIRRCVIEGNVATNRGGGVYTDEGKVFLEECVIRDNQALVGGGVAAATDAGDPTRLVNCLVRGNAATLDGGGAWGRHVFADRTLFRQNGAQRGGGAFRIVMEGPVAFVGNIASGNGGGYASTGKEPLHDSVFFENVAGGIGGGAHLVASSTITATRCVFARNEASSGSGLYIGSGDAGGSGTVEVLSCTFDGQQIRVPSEGALLASSIVRGRAPFAVGQGFATTLYSNVEGGATGAVQIGNIDADPLWIDPAVGAYGVLAGAPGIDAGDPGEIDPDGSVQDMGAVPYSPWCALWGASLGSLGFPELSGEGTLSPGSTTTLEIRKGPRFGSATLVLGATAVQAPFLGGVLLPTPDVLLGGLALDGSGTLVLQGPWPPGIPPGTRIYAQAWLVDGFAELGLSSTAGLVAAAP